MGRSGNLPMGFFSAEKDPTRQAGLGHVRTRKVTGHGFFVWSFLPSLVVWQPFTQEHTGQDKGRGRFGLCFSLDANHFTTRDIGLSTPPTQHNTDYGRRC